MLFRSAGLAGLYGPCPFGRHRSLSQTADQGPPAPGEAVGVLPSSSPSVSNFHFKSHCPRIRSASSPPLQPFPFPTIPPRDPAPIPKPSTVRRRRRGFNDMGCFLSCFRGRPDHSGGGLQVRAPPPATPCSLDPSFSIHMVTICFRGCFHGAGTARAREPARGRLPGRPCRRRHSK